MHLTLIGATSDLGQALVYAFAPELSQLTLTARQPERLNPLVADLRLRFGLDNIQVLALDVLQIDYAILEPLAASTDLLILTAGYLGDQRLAETDKTEAQRIMATNYNGPAALISYFARAMTKQQQGGIIGISSVAGERGRQSNYFYGSAKAGFTAFLDGLRHRLFASDIHVMTVLPGFMATRMTADLELPQRLTASPKQAAQRIYRAWKKRRNKIYVLPIWRLIMLVIRNIPEFIFKRTKL